jgi:hypothetical protein
MDIVLRILGNINHGGTKVTEKTFKKIFSVTSVPPWLN